MKKDELIKVLHLEDSADDSELILNELSPLVSKMDYTRVENEKDFRLQLENNQFDIILADYNLPTFDGLTALKMCTEKYPEIPFIIVSGTLGEEIAVTMLKYGASDYLLKQNLKRLVPAVAHSLEQAKLKKDKRKTEKELRESEEKFRTITENTADAIFVADQTGRYVFTNNKVTELLGFSRSEMISKSIIDLAPENQANKFLVLFQKLLTEGKVTHELELLKKDGSVVPVDLNAVTLPGGFLYASCRDITGRIKASKALEEAALRWASTFDAISDTVFIVSKDHKILAMNRAGLENPAFSNDKIIGHKCYEFIHKSATPLSNCPCVKIQKTGESSSCEYEHDDRSYHLQIWPIPDVDGKFESFVHILKDITDKKRTQKALEESEKKYRNIFENIQDVYYQINNDGILTEISPSIQRLSGYTTQELIGKPSTIFYYYPEERNLLLEKLSKNNEVWDYEVRMRTKEGIVKYTSLNAHLIFNTEGKPDGIEGSLRDIDERKHFELKLKEAKEKAEESDRLKTAFLHNISHEIRTPMNAITGFSALLNDPGLTPETRQNFTKLIGKSSNQLLSIITDLLDIATIEAGQSKILEKEININEICLRIQDQFTLLAKDKNVIVEFKTSLSDKEAIIISDETKLFQVLNNIVGNALKFTLHGSVTFGYKLKDKDIEFFIEDTGIGIPKEMHEDIFIRFRQVESSLSRQYGGNGLGLSISKAYVELLGGKIWLTSELNKGSGFYFTIPYKKVTGANNLVRSEVLEKTQKFHDLKTILVAEDEELNFKLLKFYLTPMNVTIVHAQNGLEAVEICKSGKKFDLVLMDLKMPVMNGFDATRQIKEFLPDLPIIAQTAYSTQADKEKAIACGCSDFITKPYSKEVLLSVIKKQLVND